MTYYTRDASASSTQVRAVNRVSHTGVWEVWDPDRKVWLSCSRELADNRRRDIALGNLLMTKVPEAVGLAWAARLSREEPPPDP